MTTIDIRKEGQKATSIRFADFTLRDNVVKLSVFQGSVYINTDIGSSRISSEEDAENLIKALQKAIELGWWKA